MKKLILIEVLWIALAQRKTIVMTSITISTATDLLERLLLMICRMMKRANRTSTMIRVPKKLVLIEVVWIALAQRKTIVMTSITISTATDLLERLLLMICRIMKRAHRTSMTIRVPKKLVLIEVVWIALTEHGTIVMTSITTLTATDLLEGLLLMICRMMIRATRTSMTVRVPKKLVLIEVVWIALTEHGTIVMTLTTTSTATDLLERLLVMIRCTMIRATHTSTMIRVPKKLMLIEAV
jgi:nitrogen fixation protein